MFLQILLAGCVNAGRIKHVVYLMEENRSFDHFFGWASERLGVNGLQGTEFNYVNSSDPNSEKIFVSPTADYINPCDPCHNTRCTTDKIFGWYNGHHENFSDPDMSGFVDYEYKHKRYCSVMEGFTPDKIPVITSLAEEFALGDRWFASHPGPTFPNRLFALAATSAGLTETEIPAWYHDEKGKLFPMKTIFDQIEEGGLTWKNYYNDTPWETFIKKIAYSPKNVVTQHQFYEDAKTGNLPSFSWLNPSLALHPDKKTGLGSNDQHPDHDVALGEAFYKDVYEALRASPSWNETVLIVTMDEHGGFWDHVVPPYKDIPEPGDGEESYPDKGFKWNRLGVRIPTIIISPLIPKGTVFSGPPEAQKPFPSSEYDLTSILSTTRKLLGIEDVGPLTDRDEWAGTFEHLFSLETPRTDCPMHLPDAPPPTLPIHLEAELEINDLQKHIIGHIANHVGVEYPHHLKTQHEVSLWLQWWRGSHFRSEPTVLWDHRWEQNAYQKGNEERRDKRFEEYAKYRSSPEYLVSRVPIL